MFFVLQANRKACRPPEQVPNTADLAVGQGWARSHSTAPSVSPITWASGTPPSARTLAATSSALPSPAR